MCALLQQTLLLTVILLFLDSASCFAPSLARSPSTSFRPSSSSYFSPSCRSRPQPRLWSEQVSPPQPSRTSLRAKVWNARFGFENLGIEPDVDYKWYCLKTQPGAEQRNAEQLQTYLNTVLGPRASDVRSIVVPTEEVVSSRGKKVFLLTKAVLPSIIFISLRLNPRTYDAVLSFSPISSFVGTRITKWTNRVPQAVLLPIPLTGRESRRLEALTVPAAPAAQGLPSDGASAPPPTTTRPSSPSSELLGRLPAIGSLVRVVAGSFAGYFARVCSVRADTGVLVQIFVDGRVLDEHFPLSALREVTPAELEERRTETERRAAELEDLKLRRANARKEREDKKSPFQKLRREKLREETAVEDKLLEEEQRERDRWKAFQREPKGEEDEKELEEEEEEGGGGLGDSAEIADVSDDTISSAIPQEFDFSIYASKDVDSLL